MGHLSARDGYRRLADRLNRFPLGAPLSYAAQKRGVVRRGLRPPPCLVPRASPRDASKRTARCSSVAIPWA
jgi:hypothetical protein